MYLIEVEHFDKKEEAATEVPTRDLRGENFDLAITIIDNDYG